MTATPAQAKRVVLVALASSAVLAAVSDLGKENVPRLRILLGAVLAGILLSLMADFGMASIAAGIAAVIMLTSFLVLGGDAWARLGKLVTP